AKTLAAQTALVRQLQARSVTRVYLALASGAVARDQDIDAPIGRHRVERTRMAVVAGGKPARTHVQVLNRFAAATLLECRLDTGRTHQIRVHLASIGHPLVGDRTYAGRRTERHPLLAGFGRQALHARRLELTHPDSGRRIAWECAPPADLAGLIRALIEESNR
ncbi:MAG: RNA pseudouridine synthase, partial [Acidobacteria bacterium]|nr:RNA pseudouridine synthase [Acidobacteriota bacterium]